MRFDTQDISRPRRAFLGAWTALVALLVAPGTLAAQDGFAATTLTLPGFVERQPIPTSIYLEVEARERSPAAFEGFAQGRLDAVDAAFVELMKSLMSKDYEKSGRYLIGKDAVGAGEARQKVDLYHQAFGGFEGMQVHGRVRIGDHQLVLWSVPSAQGRFLRAFAFEPAADGFRAELVSSKTPIDQLVVQAYQRRLLEPEKYAPKRAGDGGFAYPLPVGEGSAVTLLFRGQRVALDLFDQAVSTGIEALDFYRRAWMRFAERDFQGYLALHTEGSREKLQAWLDGMGAEELDRYHARVVSGRHVCFVLDADPLYLIFYSTAPEPRSPDSLLRYDYVLRDAASGELKLTNVSYQSFLDDLFGSPKLFARTPAELERKVLGPAEAK